MATVRKAITSDSTQIHHIGLSIPEFSVADETISFWPEKVIREIIASPEAIILVAEEANSICGFIIGNCNKAFQKIIIENVYVLPDFRDSGIGESLVANLMATAEKSGYQYVSTLIPEEANEAMTLYLNSGFTKGNTFKWLDRSLSDDFRLP